MSRDECVCRSKAKDGCISRRMSDKHPEHWQRGGSVFQGGHLASETSYNIDHVLYNLRFEAMSWVNHRQRLLDQPGPASIGCA